LNRLRYEAVLALSIATVSAVTACSKNQVPGRAGSTPATPGSLGPPTPVVDEQGYIEGSQWNSAEAAAGFEVVVEVEPLTTNSEGKPSSGYLGRAGAALYFRSQAGELSSMPLGGGARSAVALAVPEHVLMAADARDVYWVTPACEIFAPPARRVGACVGSPEFAAVDAEAIDVVATEFADSGQVERRLWRIPRAGGEAKHSGALEVAPFGPPPLFDGGRMYYERSDGTLFSLSLGSEHPVAFAREEPGHHLDLLHFADARALFWTSRLATTSLSETFDLVGADKRGGPARIISGSGPGPVVADATHFYWLDSTFNTLYAAPRSGGEWQTLARLEGGTFELFLDRDGLLAFDGSRLLRIRTNAAAPTRRHQTTTSLGYLTQTRDDLYVVAQPWSASAADFVPEVWRLPKAGGEPRSVLRDQLRSAPVVDDESIYYRSPRGITVARGSAAPKSLVATAQLARFPLKPSLRGADTEETSQRTLALDASHVYFSEPERGVVLRVARTGGPVTVLARLDDAPLNLALDASHLYFTTGSNVLLPARLYRVAKSGRSAPEKLADLEDNARSLALESHVWLTYGFALLRTPKQGGPLEVLRDNIGICGITLNSTTLFFTDCNIEGSVWQMQLAGGKLGAIATSLSVPSYPVADETGVYFVTVGSIDHPFSSIIGCCSIWKARSL